YMNQLANHKHSAKLGDHLPVDLTYVENAADALAIAAHSITVAALFQTVKSADERTWVETEVGELTFLLLNQEREKVVERFVSKFR
ncbi:hypothetical protein, partial [Priestia sp. SIMBA_032]